MTIYLIGHEKGIWTILGVYILPLFDIALVMLYQRRIKYSGWEDKTSSMMPQSWKDDKGGMVCPLKRTCGLGEHRCSLEMEWRMEGSEK